MSKGFEVNLALAGNTLDDLAIAMDEAKQMIKDGNIAGFNLNNSGSFTFERSGEEHLPLPELSEDEVAQIVESNPRTHDEDTMFIFHYPEGNTAENDDNHYVLKVSFDDEIQINVRLRDDEAGFEEQAFTLSSPVSPK